MASMYLHHGDGDSRISQDGGQFTPANSLQCIYNFLLWYWTSVFWSIDTCQNIRYLPTSITWPYCRLKFRAHRSHMFFWSWWLMLAINENFGVHNNVLFNYVQYSLSVIYLQQSRQLTCKHNFQLKKHFEYQEVSESTLPNLKHSGRWYNSLMSDYKVACMGY